MQSGVSSGCTTAMLLTIIEERIKAFSGGGCTAPLSFLRQFYRIPNHPNQWDLPEFEDELPVLASRGAQALPISNRRKRRIVS